MSPTNNTPANDADRFLSIGLDLGAVNAYLCVLDGSGQAVHLDSERIRRNPAGAIEALLSRLPSYCDIASVGAAAVTGAARHIYSDNEGWQTFSSPYAAIAGVVADHPDARTIISLGGQTSLVVGLEDGLDKPWRVARSPLCAAGTGRFLEQQAYRLGIPIEEFGTLALQWTQPPPRIAARCSVFAKSDLIHLQQKGWTVPAMLSGLSDSVARMVRAQWREDFVSPIVLIGGVAANDAVVRALKTVIDTGEISVPANYRYRPAVGAAILARKQPVRPQSLVPDKTGSETFYAMERSLPVTCSTDGWQPPELDGEVREAFLGVDVGSTSTKAAVIDRAGHVLAKTYLMTAGQPLEAVKQVMSNLVPMVEGKVRIEAVGVTGSGRYLVGAFIGADLIKNEITAQTRAALQVDPTVSTVFEIGGQDSKYVYLENGTVLDYQMNKACAAGTGSFIDELADQLGVSTRTGEYARLALESTSLLDLGEKCTAFMSQAVTSAQQNGVPLNTVVASLSASLAKNYLSKVVAGRRVGERVVLTGAVFYNQAIVSAFASEMPNKSFAVPEHKEVTGAIGAALLAAENRQDGQPSQFKGFSRLANETYKLRNFNCGRCENSCAISMMTTESGQRLFYGSRCDLYDSARDQDAGAARNPFLEREDLLFGSHREEMGTGPLVGIPRALMTFDLAPMLIAFLNELGVRVTLSKHTNKAVVERSLEHAYTDSCFPIKLLHGHVAELAASDCDYILIPNAIRMSAKTSDADQRYSCPLVQAAPYIVSSVFGLGERLLDPVIDFAHGDGAVIESFAAIAERLGFNHERGTTAARAALAAQAEFERRLTSVGANLTEEMERDPDAIGVVLLSRAYNAQDAGANLGMAQELAKLGVVPIPMDMLPLADEDISDASDRPYWNYERKILAATKIIARGDHLYGLFLSNFGCGPNSIIENMVEDIMGGKPLGHIEVDEHAAEAGYITRLEAFVDTVRGYHRAKIRKTGRPEDYGRSVRVSMKSGQTVYVPRMADHAAVIAAAMRACGVDCQLLPESNERSLSLSRDVTSGKECLPFRDTLGAFLRLAQEGAVKPGSRLFMAGSYGPCRLGKYPLEQQLILNKAGIDLEVMTSVSNNAYSDLGLGARFQMSAWRSAVCVDLLQRLLWSTRPYEKEKGQTDAAYADYLQRVIHAVETNGNLRTIMKNAAHDILALRDRGLPRRPLVGINGEIYLRANSFCNKDVVRVCEANGLEVEVAPMSEWLKYTIMRNLEDAWTNRELKRAIKGAVTKYASDWIEGNTARWVGKAVPEREPSARELLAASSRYLPSRNGSEAVLSIGGGVRQMADHHFAGVISVMPHGCMPGGIVAAFSQSISRTYGGKPWISLTYDGFADSVNPERIADFAEQLRHRHQGH